VLKTVERDCKDEREGHEGVLVSLRMKLWTVEQERDNAKAQLKTFE
jgi:hypothetical protein